VACFNRVVYRISGFRWSFYGVADVNHYVSLFTILFILLLCALVVSWMFRTGYKLRP